MLQWTFRYCGYSLTVWLGMQYEPKQVFLLTCKCVYTPWPKHTVLLNLTHKYWGGGASHEMFCLILNIANSNLPSHMYRPYIVRLAKNAAKKPIQLWTDTQLVLNQHHTHNILTNITCGGRWSTSADGMTRQKWRWEGVCGRECGSYTCLNTMGLTTFHRKIITLHII